jgi:hypothetical protein
LAQICRVVDVVVGNPCTPFEADLGASSMIDIELAGLSSIAQEISSQTTCSGGRVIERL